MMIQQTRTNHSIKFLSNLSFFVERLQKSSKVHDYTRHQQHSDYAFESTGESAQSYMTGQGSGICQGDRILLCQDRQTKTYRVRSIEYYASPSDLWTASLINVK